MVAAGLKWLSHILQEQRVPALCSYRIGDAQNPGPRPRRDVGPFAADLELIDTVRPATRLLQARAMDKFNRWIRRQLSAEVSESLALLPKLRLWFLRAFGNDMFKRGEAMYLFRHLVVLTQYVGPCLGHFDSVYDSGP